MSFNKQRQRFSGSVCYTTFLVWAAQAFLSLHALDGAVSKAPLQSLAAPVLAADRRLLMLVALVSSWKPTVFLRLILFLLSSNSNFRRQLLPEVYGIFRLVWL